MKALYYALLFIPLVAGAEFVQDTPISGVQQTFGVECSPDGEIYVCSVGSHQIFKRSRDGRLALVAGRGEMGYAGDGGPATEALLNEPYELRFDRNGNMYFVEMRNHLIRMVDADGRIHTLAGRPEEGFAGDGGKGENALFKRPHSIALDEQSDWLYIADIGNHRIRRLNVKTNHIETFAGTGEKTLPLDGHRVTGKSMLGPRALFIQGRTLWVALREGHSVWRIDLDSRIIKRVAGTGKKGFGSGEGSALKATFRGPKGIVASPDGIVFVVDTENQAIRRINPLKDEIDSIASPRTGANLARPHGICLNALGHVFVGDTNNHRVIRLRKK